MLMVLILRLFQRVQFHQVLVQQVTILQCLRETEFSQRIVI